MCISCVVFMSLYNRVGFDCFMFWQDNVTSLWKVVMSVLYVLQVPYLDCVPLCLFWNPFPRLPACLKNSTILVCLCQFASLTAFPCMVCFVIFVHIVHTLPLFVSSRLYKQRSEKC